MPMALNGREVQVMHLEVEWSNAETAQERFTWEPLSRIYRDVPEMVAEYFAFAKLDLKEILDQESNRRGNNKHWNKNGNQ